MRCTEHLGLAPQMPPPLAQVLEKEFGKEGTEAILRTATKDPRAMLDERRD